MPIVNIYQAGTKVASKEFYRDFMLVTDAEGQNKIRVEADEETGLQRGGNILIWVKAALDPPVLYFVPPEWELKVDGQTIIKGSTKDLESRLDVPIGGDIVELQHDNLLLLFQFFPSSKSPSPGAS